MNIKKKFIFADSSEDNLFNSALQFFSEFISAVIEIPSISYQVIYYARNYMGISYFNLFGELIDFLPLVKDVTKLSTILPLTEKHNINFVEKGITFPGWNGGLKKGAYPYSLCIFNFQGEMKSWQVGNSDTSFYNYSHQIDMDFYPGILCNVKYTKSTLFFDIFFDHGNASEISEKAEIIGKRVCNHSAVN